MRLAVARGISHPRGDCVLAVYHKRYTHVTPLSFHKETLSVGNIALLNATLDQRKRVSKYVSTGLKHTTTQPMQIIGTSCRRRAMTHPTFNPVACNAVDNRNARHYTSTIYGTAEAAAYTPNDFHAGFGSSAWPPGCTPGVRGAVLTSRFYCQALSYYKKFREIDLENFESSSCDFCTSSSYICQTLNMRRNGEYC